MLHLLRAPADDELAKTPEPAVELLDCRNGTMLVFCLDEVIGRSLRLYGEWSEHELSCLRPHVRDGTVVIDIGANIGTHTLAFAKWVPGGGVIAVEPQAEVVSVLQVNCLLNGKSNVEIVNAACGSRRGEALMATLDPSNPGATGFTPDTRLLARLRYLLRPQARWSRAVPLVRIDDLAENRPVSLMKIDAEGMEFEVLDGARRVIKAHRPAIFCEQNNTRQLSAIHDLLVGFNYRLYWLETHQFNKANFRGERDNIWWRTEMGIFANHDSVAPPGGLVEVDRNTTEIPFRYDAREGLFVA
jgi:FkbM family methyltransferase